MALISSPSLAISPVSHSLPPPNQESKNEEFEFTLLSTMAANHAFAEEEMEVNEHLGYPKAYAYLCRDRSTTPYSLGPPFTFTPYALKPDEVIISLVHFESSIS